ncbi:ABC transporter permease [Clostridium subterminale]|uniref:ABC transporter permease n=1 Tax=Clostridium subterminale TaxID=1550 RepID=A0ABN1KZI1_CLOSU
MRRWIKSALIFSILIFLVLPIISMMVWAFFKNWRATDILPNTFTLDGFKYFFTSGDLYIGIKSIIFSIEVALISLILSIMAARFFITTHIKYKGTLESIFYLPMLLPVISICLGSHKLFLNYFSSCSIAVLVLHIYFSLPYAFKLIYSYYTVWGIEDELTARGLGASFWKAFKYVNIPLYAQGYASSFFMAFIISYSQYFVNMFIGDNSHVNFSMIMTPYIGNSNRNIASVYTLMYILYGVIVMIMTSFIAKKYSNDKYREMG